MMSHPVLTFTSRGAKSEKEKSPIHSAPCLSAQDESTTNTFIFFKITALSWFFRVSVNQPGSGELCFCPHVPQTALIMMSLHCFNNNSSLRLRGIHLYQPYLLVVADHFEIFTLSRVNIWQRILNNKIRVGIRGKTNSISSTKTNIFHRCMIVSLPFVLSSAASIALNTWNSLLFKFFQKRRSLDTFGKIKKNPTLAAKMTKKGKYGPLQDVDNMPISDVRFHDIPHWSIRNPRSVKVRNTSPSLTSFRTITLSAEKQIYHHHDQALAHAVL